MYSTILDVLRVSAESCASDPCWIQQSSTGEDRILTFETAVQCVGRHGDALQDLLSTCSSSSSSQNDITLAFLCGNSLDFALSILAASHVSAGQADWSDRTIRCALLNTRWSVSDMLAALRPAESIFIIYGPEWLETAESLQDSLQGRSIKAETMPLPVFGQLQLAPTSHDPTQSQTSQPKAMFDPRRLTKEEMGNLSSDDAVLVFTSGTTSTAKGVRLSHRALLVQAAAKVSPPCRYSHSTRMLATTVPFFHVGGLSSLLAVWMAHGALVEPSGGAGGFSPSHVWQSISRKENPLNTLVVVPAMVHALQQQLPLSSKPESRVVLFPQVDLILVGGQSLPTTSRLFLQRTFPAARIVQTFACTEAASSLTFWDVTRLPEKDIMTNQVEPPGVCVGNPPDHVQLQLFATAQDGKKASVLNQPYQVGLIGTRGPHVMNGYWSKEQRNQDEWYITSDLGYWDTRGRLYFCGRETDTIRTGGETVWATEVEQVLQRHPNIAEVAVLGLPDKRFGEAVACAIVLQPNPPTTVSVRDLRTWCKQEGLTGYKQPRRLVILASLPRNSSGKILKRLLKDSFRHAPPSRL